MSDVLGVFEQAVLIAVAHLRGEGYGRTVLKDVQTRLARDVNASAAYATLERLESKGLVSSREGESTPARGGRAKRHLTITAAGLRSLAAAKATTDSIWRGVALPQKGRA
jgi:DNA-binding PadR family transcriptional regulator